MSGVDWNYFDKFDVLDRKYLPSWGEGENMATQIITAVCKLIYKWYNDGDVYDNTHYMVGWANDLSSYANWLDKYTGATYILDRIEDCKTDDGYEHILKDLADAMYDVEFLAMMEKKQKVGTIYDCDGKFKFVERDDEDNYEWSYEDEDEDEYYDEEEEDEDVYESI